MPFNPDMAPEKPGFVLQQSTAHKLILAIAQSDKNFKIVKLTHAMLGNVRDASTGKVSHSLWHIHRPLLHPVLFVHSADHQSHPSV